MPSSSHYETFKATVEAPKLLQNLRNQGLQPTIRYSRTAGIAELLQRFCPRCWRVTSQMLKYLPPETQTLPSPLYVVFWWDLLCLERGHYHFYFETEQIFVCLGLHAFNKLPLQSVWKNVKPLATMFLRIKWTPWLVSRRSTYHWPSRTFWGTHHVAFVRKQFSKSVFFNMKKAYNTTWWFPKNGRKGKMEACHEKIRKRGGCLSRRFGK